MSALWLVARQRSGASTSCRYRPRGYSVAWPRALSHGQALATNIRSNNRKPSSAIARTWHQSNVQGLQRCRRRCRANLGKIISHRPGNSMTRCRASGRAWRARYAIAFGLGAYIARLSLDRTNRGEMRGTADNGSAASRASACWNCLGAGSARAPAAIPALGSFPRPPRARVTLLWPSGSQELDFRG
jgi:hypothetical protein